MPTGVRDGLADAIPGLTTDTCACVVGDVGGGFGMKTGIYPEDIAVATPRCTLKRPVKWQAERLEDFLRRARPRRASAAELALDADGKVLALRVRSLANVGAYGTTTGVAIQLLIGPWVRPASTTSRPSTAVHRGADHTARPPAPTAAPAGPRRSTSPSG
jgi:carbon-monoxide dehydrogenase large subunit